MTTPADTLTTAQYAGVVDATNPTIGLAFGAYDATSSDNAVATISTGGGNTIAVVAQGAGSVDVTITRLSDNAQSVIAVTVTEVVSNPGTFEAHLGDAQAK